MPNTSTIHIKTDFDCIVYDYGQELGITNADVYSNFEFRKGEHELTFVYTKDTNISKILNYTVKETDCEYKLIVDMAETICERAMKYYDLKEYSSVYNLFVIVAERGLAVAQYYLGLCFKNGYGTEENMFKAWKWFKKAADQGYPDAQYELGLFLCLPVPTYEEFMEKVEWFHKAAEQGHIDAQLSLGYLTRSCNINGITDPVKSLEWFKRAAEQGSDEARKELVNSYYDLGSCYEDGRWVEKDIDKAIMWYSKAADSGHVDAEYRLGMLYWDDYYSDWNVKSLLKAIEWFTKAAEHSSNPDKEIIRTCFYDLEGYCKRHKNPIEAVDWLTNKAGKGCDMAQWCLGVCYEYGRGVTIDLNKSKEWYTKSAKQGNQDAQTALNNLKQNVGKHIEYYLFFDTETTGLPINYNAPSSDTNNWPRLVQLAWILTDQNGNRLKNIGIGNYIIKPDGFVIPPAASNVHGITTQKVQKEGVALEVVIELFLSCFDKASYVVGHNVAFDKKIIGAELVRLGMNDIMDIKTSFCTMLSSIDFCKIPSYNGLGYKYPKLQELYKKLFGCEFDDAHNAMCDIEATEKCFWELRKRKLI